MCWSPDADLAAGSVIAVLGVGALAGVRRRTALPLAALPLLLGVHQVVESVVWRGQDGTVSPEVAASARVVWAVIALPVLPLLVPIAVLLASLATATASASAVTVRRRLLVLAGIGTATSVVLAVTVARGPIAAHVHGHTLAYSVGIPAAPLVIAGYLVATLGPAPGPGPRYPDARRSLRGRQCGLLPRLAAGVRLDLVCARGGGEPDSAALGLAAADDHEWSRHPR